MLKIFRKKGVMKKLLWVVAVIIIISFGFLGTAYLLTDTQRPDSAGSVYGKKISFQDFETFYRDAQTQAILTHGREYPKVRQFLNLEAETWDRIALHELAKRKRVKVSDDEVIDYIASFESFKRDGAFDRYLYEDIIEQNLGQTARAFEEGIRRQLTMMKLLENEIQGITVSDEEVLAEYKQRNDRIRVQYLLHRPEQFVDKTEISEEAIRNYYESHRQDFREPLAIRVSYVVYPFDAESTDEEKEKSAEQIEELYGALLEGKDFAQTAEERQLPIKQSGYFSMEKPDLSLGWPFDVYQRLFSMDEGDFTEPIETSQGLVLVKLEEKRAAFVPPLADTRDNVVKALRQEKASEVARQTAQEAREHIRNALAESKSFEDAVKPLGLDIKTTPYFTRGQYLPEVGLSQDFQQAAFSLSPDQPLSDVVETGSGYALLYWDNRQEADLAKFDAEKENLKKELLEAKRNQFVTDYISKLRVDANIQSNLQSAGSR